MIRITMLFAAALMISGCSTMTPGRYAPSADNVQLLKTYKGNKIMVAQLAEPAVYDPGCRLMGPIKAGDNLTISQFIQKAFNDEFKFAELYDTKGVQLSGSVDKVEFSSTDGLTNGWWSIGITLKSPNGQQLSAQVHHTFSSGFDAITACNQTANALGPAVQDLIYKTVSHPQFVALMQQ